MSLLSRVVARRYGLPPVTNRVRTLHHDVPAADGVTLATDVHLPVGRTPRATLLVRSPYGRRGTWGWLYAQSFAERGYVAVSQSTRGGYGSGGVPQPMVSDPADGSATVEWIRRQPWFTGELVLLGASYLAWSTWATATEKLPELAAIISHVGPHEWASVHRPGGSIDLETMMLWAREQLGPERPDSIVLSRLRPDGRGEVDLSPLLDAPQRQGIARILSGEPTWVTEWLDHERDDAYWSGYDASAALETVTCPVLVIGGQQDLFADHSWHQVQRLEEREVPVDLIMGPWTHRDVKSVWDTFFTESFAWLEKVMDGAVVGGRRSVFDTGTQQWAELAATEGTRSSRWYLSGAVLTTAEATAEATAEIEPTARSWRHDPLDPVPAIGGARFAPDAGAVQQNEIEQRADLLTFTSEPLAAPLTLAGRAEVHLDVTSDAEVWDLVVRLCDVSPDGTSTLVTDAVRRRFESSPGTTRVRLGHRVHTFEAGHRLRLHVASSSFPRWQHCTGESRRQHDATEPRGSTQTLSSTGGRPSSIELPVRPG